MPWHKLRPIPVQENPVAKRQHRDRAHEEQIPAQPGAQEQSGSTGRPTETEQGSNGQRKNSGQDRYGQSGFGGQQKSETAGQERYRRSGSDADAAPRGNRGSGSLDAEKDGVDVPADSRKDKHTGR
jgi:hypothetical protein